MAYRTLRVGFEQRESHAFFVPKKVKNTLIMEKKNTAPTVAEQKQEFLLPKSANVFKSELLRAAREIFT